MFIGNIGNNAFGHLHRYLRNMAKTSQITKIQHNIIYTTHQNVCTTQYNEGETVTTMII